MSRQAGALSRFTNMPSNWERLFQVLLPVAQVYRRRANNAASWALRCERVNAERAADRQRAARRVSA